MQSISKQGISINTVASLLRDQPLVPGNCDLTRGVVFHQGDNIMQNRTLGLFKSGL